MKKERSFRPPQVVLDTVAKFDGEPEVLPLDSTAIPLSGLRQLHTYLKRADMVAKGDPWVHQGGNPALMWSRRVLRQEGIIKASPIGDTFIPEAIDIQLGPNIIAGFTKEDSDAVLEKFNDAGVPASVIPVDEGTYAFYAGSADHAYEFGKGIMEIPDIKLDDVSMLDESRNRITSICKAAKDNITGVQCQSLLNAPVPVEVDWDEIYLLKSIDHEGRQAKVLKVDDELGLVLGWAIICTVDDEPYFDKQDDYIPDHGMLHAASDFMQNSRVAKEMHVGDEKGTVVFAWPMTKEIAKAFGIEVSQTGLMIAMKPDNEDMLEKFRDGTYNGFSIGGHRISEFTEEVD